MNQNSVRYIVIFALYRLLLQEVDHKTNNLCKKICQEYDGYEDTRVSIDFPNTTPILVHSKRKCE